MSEYLEDPLNDVAAQRQEVDDDQLDLREGAELPPEAPEADVAEQHLIVPTPIEDERG